MVRSYCPNFNDSHFLYGDYYSSKASWYRLAVHFCDENKRKAEGKECKEKSEIEEYFSKTIISLVGTFYTPSLKTYT